jgi:DNA-binding response OmpR family regulator
MAKLICVVDDDEFVLAEIVHDLQAMGFETLAVRDSRQAPQLLAEHPVDAVVVDIVMPDKDGVELIAEVRRGWPELRIIAISGDGRIGPKTYLRIARHVGANACLAKPVNPEALAAAIEGVESQDSGVQSQSTNAETVVAGGRRAPKARGS